MGLTLIFQLAAHRVILAEERWCAGQFGETYLKYCEIVRRYF
jgi:protein-S-isoprenylcysteine O-methyltransferase Ste14